MDVARPDRVGVVEGLVDGRARLGLAPRKGGKAVFAARHIAAPGVEGDAGKARVSQRGRNNIGRRVIGPVKLHRIEPRRGCGTDRVGKVAAGPEKSQIGRELHISLRSRRHVQRPPGLFDPLFRRLDP
jgi:hypothetical protein